MATAMAQKSHVQINQATSFDTVSCVLRVSLHHLCYMRGIFPENVFSDTTFEQLEGMTFKLLKNKGGTQATSKLISWIEKGVIDALKRGYIKKLIFGFSSDEQVQCILEEYVFSFNHDVKGKITMEVTKNAKSSKKKPTVESVKHQVVKMVRSLCEITRTLEALPDEYYIFAKMEFCDSCPDEYEPKGFKPAEDNAVGYFEAKPFAMRMGEVITPYHKVQLACKSVLDTTDFQKPDTRQPFADNISRWQITADGATTTAGLGYGSENHVVNGTKSYAPSKSFQRRGVNRETVPESEFLSQPPPPFDGGDHPMTTTTTKPSKHRNQYIQLHDLSLAQINSIKDWVLSRRNVHIVDVMTQFNLSSDLINEVLAGMVADGVIQADDDGENQFIVGGTGMFTATEKDVAGHLEELCVVDDGKQAKTAAAGNAAGVRTTRRNNKHTTPASSAGGEYSAPGTAATQSIATRAVGRSTKAKHNKRPAASEATQGDDQGHNGGKRKYYPETQVSGDVNEAYNKKMSIVEKPLHVKRARSTRLGRMAA